MKTRLIFAIVLMAAIAGTGACKKDKDKDTPKSSAKQIVGFATGTEVWCSGNCGNLITHQFCKTAVVNVSEAVIEVSDKATFTKKSGTDFFTAAGVVYTVTAEDGTTADYTVKAEHTTVICP